MGQHLSQPLTSKVTTQVGGEEGPNIGSCCMNGWRQGMEDTHGVVVERDCLGLSVCDGHGGAGVSEYLGKELLPRSMGLKPSGCGVDIPDTSLVELQLEIDKEVNKKLDTGTQGSTAAMALLIPLTTCKGIEYNTIISNVGDSRIMLGQQHNGAYKAIPLTTDHTPSLPSESQRVLAAGSTIVNNRVNGQLSVTRAFGDSKFKSATHLSPRQQAVTANPEITRVTTYPGDFLILCCDGITEGGVFTCEQLVAFTAERLDKTMAPRDIASAICEEALARGSKDNLTCIVARLGLGLGGEGQTERTFVPGRFEVGDNFRVAYEAAAVSAGYTLGEALQMRYNIISKDPVGSERELSTFGGGPPEGVDPLAWFEELVENGLPTAPTVQYQHEEEEEEGEGEEEEEEEEKYDTESDDEAPVCIIHSQNPSQPSQTKQGELNKRKCEYEAPDAKQPRLDP